MKKRVLSVLLIVVLVFTMTAAAIPGHNYNDVDGHWAEDAIARWSHYGVIEGYDGIFNPNGALTRAQLAAIIARLLDLPAAADSGFADVDGHWAEDVINACAAAGIMLGDGTNARPDDTASREETMVMLGRALGITPIANADFSDYDDGHDVSDWAEGYVAALTEAGIVNGMDDGTLSPTHDINRASTVTILNKAIAAYANQAGQTVEAEGSGIVLVVAPDVTVKGEADSVVIAQGAEGGTITLDNATVGSVNVTAEDSTLVVSGKSEVENVEVSESATNTEIKANSGASIENVNNAATGTTVSGSGSVSNVTTSGDNTKVETNGTKVEAAEGTTGTTAGNSSVAGGSSVTTPSTPSGGSSDSGDSHSHSWGTWISNNDGTHTRSYNCGHTNSETKDCTPGEDGKCTDCSFDIASVNLIGTADELKAFRDAVNAGTYDGKPVVLTADIALTVAWTPIGTWENPYYGSFNGKGNTIKGLTISDESSTNEFGLFGVIGGGNVVIEDIIFTDVSINLPAARHVSAVFGYAPNNENFKDSSKAGEAAVKWDGNATIGTNDITVKGITVNGSISAKQHVGGVVGKIYANGNVLIEDCVNNAAVTATGASTASGVVGYLDTSDVSKTTITGNTNNGTVTAKTAVAGIVNKGNNKDYQITNNTNTGNIVITTETNSWDFITPFTETATKLSGNTNSGKLFEGENETKHQGNIIVPSGSTLEITDSALEYGFILNNGTLNISAAGVQIRSIENNGALNISEKVTVSDTVRMCADCDNTVLTIPAGSSITTLILNKDNLNITNGGTVSKVYKEGDGQVGIVLKSMTNTGAFTTYTSKDPSITIADSLTNSGTLTTKSVIVLNDSAAFVNNGTITSGIRVAGAGVTIKNAGEITATSNGSTTHNTCTFDVANTTELCIDNTGGTFGLYVYIKAEGAYKVKGIDSYGAVSGLSITATEANGIKTLTAADPSVVKIGTAEEIVAFAASVNGGTDYSGKTIKLTTDIDLTDVEWVPIGTSEHPFSGIFDGNNKTITGLSNTGNGTAPFGLFGYGIGNVTVKNIIIEDVNITGGGEYTAAVMGRYILEEDQNAATYNVNFENITVGVIGENGESDSEIVGTDKAAAILGCNYKSGSPEKNKTITFTFKNCVNNANITGTATGRIGGIAAAVSGEFPADGKNNTIKVVFDSCVNNGTIASNSATYKTGAIMGFGGGLGNFTFSNCVNNGTADGDLLGRYNISTPLYKVNRSSETTFMHLDFEPQNLTIYDIGANYHVAVTYVWDIENFPARNHYDTGNYVVGTNLADDEWRITIDGKHYRIPVQVPVDGINDEGVVEDTAHLKSNPADIPNHWTGNDYTITVNGRETMNPTIGKVIEYAYEKETPGK